MPRTHNRRHGQRKPRIEIKVVTDGGSIEYRHAKGDLRPDGKQTPGPSEHDFSLARGLINHLLSGR